MNRHTFRSSLFITAMLAASAAFAGADIVKCVDQNGRVTLTDAQCTEGGEAIVVASAADTVPAASADPQSETPAAPAARRLSTERIVLAPAQLKRDSWTSPRAGVRMLSRDAETLKAARLSMQVLDQASATLRHQRLAGLN
jgi:hypothetical protein